MSSQDDDDYVSLSFKGFPGQRDWQDIFKIKFGVFVAVSEPTNRLLGGIKDLLEAELSEELKRND